MSDFIHKIDYNVAKFFHEVYLWLGEFSNGLMKVISYLGEAGILFLLIGFGLALFKRTRKMGGTIILSVAIGFLITNVFLKNIIGRARPFENVGSDYFKWWLDAGAVQETGHSFPSGHTTATTAFSLAIFLTLNKKYSWPILFFPIVMASSRIYLMVHYFTDCLGGIAVGSASALIAYFVAKWVYSSKLKLFVWVRNFDIFKPKNTKPSMEQDLTSINDKSDVSGEDFVYVTQDKEKQTQPEVEKNQENDK